MPNLVSSAVKLLKNHYPYIITNPKKDLELNQFDKVICIGRPFDNVYDPFRQEEFISSESNSEHSSESYNSDESNNSDKFKPRQSISKKTINEDLENLNEEQLLERLKNLKHLAKGKDKRFSILNANKTNQCNVIEEANENQIKSESDSSSSGSESDASKSEADSQSNKDNYSEKNEDNDDIDGINFIIKQNSKTNSSNKGNKVINNNNYRIKINANN